MLEGRNEILLRGKALKFVGILQKYALELIIIWETFEKFEKNASFPKIV